MRFRNFQSKKTTDSSEYTRRKGNIELLKNARSKISNNSIKRNYIINFDTNNIDWFISYDIYKRFVEGFYLTEPSCNIIANAPLIIDHAMTSEISYNDMFEYIKDQFYESHCDKYDKLLKVSICKEKSNTLYSYGTYFRNKEQKMYNFPIKVNLDNCEYRDLVYNPTHCEDPLELPRCCESNNELKEHQHMFPSQYNYRYYLHNHEINPHNKDGKYLFTNYVHTLPFSIFPRMKKDSECLFVKPSGATKNKINKGDDDLID